MPGVRASFEFHAEDFSRSLTQYLRAVQNGQPRADIVKNQMKLAVKAIIDLTPFETLAQGRAVVKRDLTAAEKPYGVDGGAFPIKNIRDTGLRGRLEQYMQEKDYGKIKEIWARIGANTGFKMEDFSEDLHHSNMDSRARPYGDKQILVPQVDQWRDYLAHLRGQVGRARGGWVASAEAFGLSLPQWVTRWKAGGSVDALIEPGAVTFTMINRAVFIPRYRYQSRVQLALAGREKAMATDLRRWLNGQATAAGFKT